MVFAAGGEQRGLVGEVGEVGADHPGCGRGEGVEVDVVGERERPGVHIEDLAAARPVGWLDGDAAVEAAGAEQGGVEDLGPVSGAEHDDGLGGLEAVHLGEDLVERLLALVVGAGDRDDPWRERPMASSSSMKMIDGAASLAFANRSRTREAPTPTIASMNSDAAIEKNAACASPATARASSVLPVPGGPESSTPCGMRPPSRP